MYDLLGIAPTADTRRVIVIVPICVTAHMITIIIFVITIVIIGIAILSFVTSIINSIRIIRGGTDCRTSAGTTAAAHRGRP